MKQLRLSLILAALALAPACQAESANAPTVRVERQDLLIEVDVSGTLKATQSDPIQPPPIDDYWGYKIAMMAPDGSEVKKGEPILAFDPTQLRQRLERKEADRDTAKTQVETSEAQARVERYDDELAMADAEAQRRKAALKADVPEGIVASVVLEKAQKDLEIARERVEHLQSRSRDARKQSQGDIQYWENQHRLAQAKVERLAEAIESLTVKAPRDGTVVYETDWEGEKKKVGDEVWRISTVMKIVSLDSMEALGEVDEVDSSQVAAGQSVALHLDSQPDVVLRGKVASVSAMVRRQSPQNPLKVAELQIELEPNERLRLRPGMRFRGKVLTDKVADALVVPLDAIVPTPEGPMARRRRGYEVQLVPVQVGRRNAELVEILSGLEPGDELLRGEVEP